MKKITITLTKQEYQDFLKPITGEAGGQNLVRKLQAEISTKNILELDDETCGKIVRYSNYKDGGGFETRLKIIKKHF